MRGHCTGASGLVNLAIPMELSYEEVGEILRLIEALEYDEVTVEFGDLRIHALRRAAPGSATEAAAKRQPAPGAAGGGRPAVELEPSSRPEPSESGDPTGDGAPEVEGAVAVRAPMVGTFFRGPGPDEDPFVEVGSHVGAGDQVGIVEVMKLMNAVTAETAGTVLRIDAENAQLVEYGQALLWIESEG